jgi:hypothetical protein
MSEPSLLFPATPWVIKPLVLDQVYTDRGEFFDYFYRAALDAAGRRTMSTVLLGRRRMGKTEIFRRKMGATKYVQKHQTALQFRAADH